MRSARPFISNDLFYEFSNIICHEIPHSELEQKIIDSKVTPVLFLKTELLMNYIDLLLSIRRNFILITTCNDDMCVPHIDFPANRDSYHDKWNILLCSPNLIKWYTKNSSMVHEKIQPIPLGAKWQWRSTDFFGEDKTNTLRIFNELCLTPETKLHDVHLKQNLLYFNFTAWTTDQPFFKPHTNVRNNIIKDLTEKGFAYNANSDFEDYMKILKTYKFCVSPPGRGIDVHRTWEALMVGTIPIVMSSPLDSLYEKLPVVIVDDFSVINHDFLNEKYAGMLQKKYDFSILYSDYWEKEIHKCKTETKYTAVIIEPRCHPALSFVLNNFLTNLSPDWNVIIMHGTKNIDFVNNIIHTDLCEHASRITMINLNVENLNHVSEYNKLLLNEWFYQQIPTETFLVFQTDTIILERNRHSINDYLQYDYVGAPWKEVYLPEYGIHEYNVSGNGGLSLRKKSKMLEIIDKNKDNKMFEILNEDICISTVKNVVLYKPDFEKAKRFSVETIYSEESFGIHCPWRWLSVEELKEMIHKDKSVLDLILYEKK